MLKFITVSALLLCAAVSFAQFENPSVNYVTVAPSGACSAGVPMQVVTGSGAVYTCQTGTWAAVAGGGGGSVSIDGGAGITTSPSPLTGSGTISLTNASGVTAPANDFMIWDGLGNASDSGVQLFGLIGTGRNAQSVKSFTTNNLATWDNTYTLVDSGLAVANLTGIVANALPSGCAVTSNITLNTSTATTICAAATTQVVGFQCSGAGVATAGTLPQLIILAKTNTGTGTAQGSMTTTTLVGGTVLNVFLSTTFATVVTYGTTAAPYNWSVSGVGSGVTIAAKLGGTGSPAGVIYAGSTCIFY